MSNRTIEQWLELPLPERREQAREAIAQARASIDSHHTFISVVDDDVAMAEDGELAAVPYSVKDNTDVAGLPTTGGHPALHGSVPAIDASTVRSLRDAGALTIGKNNMHELAFGLTSNNGHYGPSRNPHDPARTAGGSSGGSAAAVALGVVPFALGTDTGASVTTPSGYCGVVGFRPSTGRYPGDGVIHLTWTRDTIGVHANTVRDVQLVDRVITRSSDPTDEIAPKQLRLGVVRSFLDDLDPEVGDATERALANLASAGVELVDAEVPRANELAGAGFHMVFFEHPVGLRTYLAGLEPEYRELTLEQMAERSGSSDVRKMLELMISSPVSVQAYREASEQRNLLRRLYQQTFAESGVDALIFPTAPNLAPVLGDDERIELNGTMRDMFPTATRHVAPGGLAGAPQLSLPASRPKGKLPVGITLEGGIGQDGRLLQAGRAISHLL